MKVNVIVFIDSLGSCKLQISGLRKQKRKTLSCLSFWFCSHLSYYGLLRLTFINLSFKKRLVHHILQHIEDVRWDCPGRKKLQTWGKVIALHSDSKYCIRIDIDECKKLGVISITEVTASNRLYISIGKNLKNLPTFLQGFSRPYRKYCSVLQIKIHKNTGKTRSMAFTTSPSN